MKVGDQIPADNPTGEKDTEFGNTVDPPSWRKLVLLAPKKDGSFADVELLRPLWWLEEQAAEVGGTVDIHVPECGIEGRAEVLAIETCPPIKHDSRFRIVTGTFKHQASKVLDVYVEGLDEPIGTTPNHPFWSEDRQKFVRADELKEGEHLRAFNGTPIVRRVIPLADPEPVLNLEVQCDHVYHVARSGVLVHNAIQLLLPGLQDAFQGGTNYLYQLVNQSGDIVYYGIADGSGNLRRRLLDHSKKKAGEFVSMQIMARGLSRVEAMTLETQLIREGLREGRPLLNQTPSIAHVASDILASAQQKLSTNALFSWCAR